MVFFRVIFIWILLLTTVKIHAQKLNLGIHYFAGSGESADLGVDINFSKNINKNIFQLGTELRSIDWGNHWGLNLSYGRTYFTKKAFSLSGLTSVHPGLALFHENSFLSYGVSHSFNINWQSNKRSFLELNVGARYNICPAYEQYGNNTQFELPLSLRWGIQLGKSSK
jgi:hypothetical protein